MPVVLATFRQGKYLHRNTVLRRGTCLDASTVLRLEMCMWLRAPKPHGSDVCRLFLHDGRNNVALMALFYIGLSYGRLSGRKKTGWRAMVQTLDGRLSICAVTMSMSASTIACSSLPVCHLFVWPSLSFFVRESISRERTCEFADRRNTVFIYNGI